MDRFKKRHDLLFGIFHGESASVNMETVKEWKRKLPEIIKDYSFKDILTLIKQGYSITSCRTVNYVVKREKYHDGKLSQMFFYVFMLMLVEKLNLLVSENSKIFAFSNT